MDCEFETVQVIAVNNQPKVNRMKRYKVFISPKYAAWNNRTTAWECDADSKADALSQAKRHVWDSGHDVHDAPLEYQVTELERNTQ